MKSEDEENYINFLNAQWEDGMCANLQVVHMDGVYWLSKEMLFMRLILSKARLLRTLSISCAAENTTSMRALQRSYKASPQAQILFEGKEKYFLRQKISDVNFSRFACIYVSKYV
jgi:hypothetical protein